MLKMSNNLESKEFVDFLRKNGGENVAKYIDKYGIDKMPPWNYQGAKNINEYFEKLLKNNIVVDMKNLPKDIVL